jgi:hypothetical protein
VMAPATSSETPPTAPSDPIARAHALADRSWDTPRQLRVLLWTLVMLCLVSGGMAARAASARVRETREIERRTASLSAEAVDVYRGLASADVAAAIDFLPGRQPDPSLRKRYEEDVARAADLLARTATQTERLGVAADRIADIARLLPEYTGLMEQARAERRDGLEIQATARAASDALVAKSGNSLRQASELMQSTILRRTEALHRIASQNLDRQYADAQSVPRAAVFLAALTFVALLAGQVLIAVKTKRVFNEWLLIATLALVGAGGSWAYEFRVSDDNLANSRRRSELVTDALGQAQIASLQARASEVLALVPPQIDSYELDFSERIQRLARKGGKDEELRPGAGGALGAARTFASEPTKGLVEDAVKQTGVWLAAHERVRESFKSQRYEEAINRAVSSEPNSAATALDDLSDILEKAVSAERTAFAQDVKKSRQAIAYLPALIIVLAFVSAASVTLGLTQRLKEYP